MTWLLIAAATWLVLVVLAGLAIGRSLRAADRRDEARRAACDGARVGERPVDGSTGSSCRASRADATSGTWVLVGERDR